jgi:iron complex outermembrane receptor protein
VLERLQQVPAFGGATLDPCAPQAPVSEGGSGVTRLSAQQCALSGVTQAEYNALSNLTPCIVNQGVCNNVTYHPGGNPNLKPEKADSMTLGMVVQPRFLPGFTASIDYYSINVKNAFNYVHLDLLTSECYTQHVAFYCGLITRDQTTGEITDINDEYQNAGFEKNAGIDFTSNYTFPLPNGPHGMKLGRLNLGLNGTIYTNISEEDAPGTTPYSCLGYFGFTCREPDPIYRQYTSIGWGMPWKGNITLLWRYTAPTANAKLSSNPELTSVPSSYNTDTYPLIRHLPAANYLDLAFNYPLTSKITVRCNVQNLLDSTPPVVGNSYVAATGADSTLNSYPNYYDELGRTLTIGLHATF